VAAPKTFTDTPGPIRGDLRGINPFVRDTREGMKGLRTQPDGRVDAP